MGRTTSKQISWAVGIALGFGLMAAGRAAVAQSSCTELSGAIYCGTQRSHTQVGNQVIFPHGPPARRVGNFLVLQEHGKTRLVGGLPPARGTAPPEGARPAGSLIGLNKGRGFGSFAFPSGAAGKLSGRP